MYFASLKFRGLLIIALLLTAGVGIAFTKGGAQVEDSIVSYIVDPNTEDVQLYWKTDEGNILGSIQNLEAFTKAKHKKLLFAINAGMYLADRSPQGLFIQAHKLLNEMNTGDGEGNFYMKPNGVFYLTKDKNAVVCNAVNFVHDKNIAYATQSGPMLVIDGEIHPAFKMGSANLNIRNGVGILPGNKIVFAISKVEINFYDFANCFRQLGCRQALYLDGFVSRAYIPKKNWVQTDGNFGVMIGVTERGRGK